MGGLSQALVARLDAMRETYAAPRADVHVVVASAAVLSEAPLLVGAGHQALLSTGLVAVRRPAGVAVGRVPIGHDTVGVVQRIPVAVDGAVTNGAFVGCHRFLLSARIRSRMMRSASSRSKSARSRSSVIESKAWSSVAIGCPRWLRGLVARVAVAGAPGVWPDGPSWGGDHLRPRVA